MHLFSFFMLCLGLTAIVALIYYIYLSYTTHSSIWWEGT